MSNPMENWVWPEWRVFGLDCEPELIAWFAGFTARGWLPVDAVTVHYGLDTANPEVAVVSALPDGIAPYTAPWTAGSANRLEAVIAGLAGHSCLQGSAIHRSLNGGEVEWSPARVALAGVSYPFIEALVHGVWLMGGRVDNQLVGILTRRHREVSLRVDSSEMRA